MRKKLTILGALTALTVVALGVFQNAGGVSAVPVQTFSVSDINIEYCYVPKEAGYPDADEDHAQYPDPGAGESSMCDAGTLAEPLTPSTPVDTFTLITDPWGSRLQLPISFTQGGASGWGTSAVACGAVDANNECTAGTVTGNVTARVDLGCGFGGVGTEDILAKGGTGGPIGSWPNDLLWDPVDFVRTSQSPSRWGGSGGVGADPNEGIPGPGSPNAYVLDIVPFPKSAPNEWNFSAIDTASITGLSIGGAGIITLPSPVLLQLASYESSYASQPDLGASVALLGGQPGVPPSDNTSGGLPPDIQCLDTPQHSVTATATLVTPSVDTKVVRFTIFTSSEDLRDASQDRILVWECRQIGTGFTDADDDCLVDSSDPDTLDTDSDNDGVPDGVEVLVGGAVGAGDVPVAADTDGASDYDEIFTFTNPAVNDSDGDGQLDKLDVRPTNTCAGNLAACPLGAGNQDALDTSDDNCPADANAGQANTDSNNNYHGKIDDDGTIAGVQVSSSSGVASMTGDMTNSAPAVESASVHFTNPSEDILGDACDDDQDNDAFPDAGEPTMTIVDWDTSATSVCKGPGVGLAPAITLTIADGDSDQDMVLDGRECQFRSRPDVASKLVATCPAAIPAPTGPVGDSPGCAQPGNTISANPCAGQNPDSDDLCLPRSTGVHTNVERQFRTHGINVAPVGTQVNDTDGCGAVGDADNDSDQDTLGAACIDPPTAGFFFGLFDGDEILFYNTGPTQVDSDRDGCPDNEEVIDVNGSGTVSSGDQLALANKVSDNVTNASGIIDPANSVPAGQGGGSSINFDLNKDGSVSSGDQLAMSKAAGTPLANCSSNPGSGNSTDSPVTFGAATKP